MSEDDVRAVVPPEPAEKQTVHARLPWRMPENLRYKPASEGDRRRFEAWRDTHPETLNIEDREHVAWCAWIAAQGGPGS